MGGTKSGELESAQKHLETAYRWAPSNADLNFLLGYLHFKQKDYAQAGIYLGTAALLSPHSAQTLTLLGRTNLLRENYAAATCSHDRKLCRSECVPCVADSCGALAWPPKHCLYQHHASCRFFF